MLLYYSFNSDASCVTIGTRTGFAVCNTDPIVGRCHETIEGCRIVELLYCTPLICYVGSGDTPGSSPRQITLWHSTTREIILQTGLESSIISCRMNKAVLIAVADTNFIHIFDIATLNRLQILLTSSDEVNKHVVALSTEDTSYLTYPSPSHIGEVVIHDTINQKMLGHIQAHKSPICQLAFNPTGDMLATASITGTLIRVFSVPSGEPIHSFRRGLQSVYINSLCFCALSQFLSAGSSAGTVHVFLLPDAVKALMDQVESNSVTASTSSSSYSTKNSKNSSPENAYGGYAKNNNTAVTAQSSSSLSFTTPPHSKLRVSSSSPPSTPPAAAAAATSTSPSSSSSSSSSSPWQWKNAFKFVQDVAVSAVSVSAEFLSAQGVLPATAQEFTDSSRAVCICQLPAMPAGSSSSSSAGNGHLSASRNSSVKSSSGSSSSSSSSAHRSVSRNSSSRVDSSSLDAAATAAAGASSTVYRFKAAIYRPDAVNPSSLLDSSSGSGSGVSRSRGQSLLAPDPLLAASAPSLTCSSSTTSTSTHIKIVVVTESGYMYRFSLPSISAILANISQVSASQLHSAHAPAYGPAATGSPTKSASAVYHSSSAAVTHSASAYGGGGSSGVNSSGWRMRAPIKIAAWEDEACLIDDDHHHDEPLNN